MTNKRKINPGALSLVATFLEEMREELDPNADPDNLFGDADIEEILDRLQARVHASKAPVQVNDR